MATSDFNFDLAEPLQTTTTRHQRNFSASLLSNIKFAPRTLEQREADAARNAPKYAREKAVNSILTARFRRAKGDFDAFWGYNIDEAWDADAGVWRDDKDPWLRLGGAAADGAGAANTAEGGGGGLAVMGEFLRGVATERRGAQEEGIERAPLNAEELEALALAVVRVARVDVKAAGRGVAALGEEFKKNVVELVAQVKTEFNLPDQAPLVEDAAEEEEDEEVEHANGANGVNGA